MEIEFTNEQLEVIKHDCARHCVVRAGPGTGKSLTVVALAQRIANEKNDEKIKFLTFTRAATSELAKKISSSNSLVITPSTIHSFAMSILMLNQDLLYIPLPLRIPSEYETSKIIYKYIKSKCRIRMDKIPKLIRLMASKWESLMVDQSIEFNSQERTNFQIAFDSAVKIFGFTLLAQLPELLRMMINENGTIKGLDLKFLIVDEYQDLNKCEEKLLNILQSKGITIFAVGDEDQSIYSFRHAHPAGIRNFESTFTPADRYDLSICHRCPNNLIQWSQHVIQSDSQRSQKPTPTSLSTNSASIHLLKFKGEKSEAKGVAKIIAYLINKKQFKAEEILVLTRTDSKDHFTRGIKEYLKSKEIAIYDSKEFARSLESENVIKLFALLRLLDNINDSLAWATLIQGSSLDAITYQADINGIDFANAVLNEINNNFPTIRNNKMKNLLITTKNLIDIYKEQVKKLNITEWGRWIVDNGNIILSCDISPELTKLLFEVDKRIDNKNASLGYYLSQVVPILKDLANEQQNGVRFMTMQSSKGITVRATFIVGVDNELIPNPFGDFNEERRLLYVAMTRAQEILILTWAGRRKGPQARSGRLNVSGQRNYSVFLQNGPVDSEDGDDFIKNLKNNF